MVLFGCKSGVDERGGKKEKYREIQSARGSSEMINEPGRVDVRFVYGGELDTGISRA